MTKTFNLLPGSPVSIYGAGAFGQSIYNKVKVIYDVKCFIDKNVKAVNGLNIIVNDLEHLSGYQQSVVLVCTHNANWHYEIAEDLFERGFDKIIFLAVSDVYSPKMSIAMNKIYNFFLEEQYDDLYDIPCYQMMKHQVNSFSEENIIRENSNYVITWCAKELLYTSKKSMVQRISTLTERNNTYFDIPMIATELYMDLFSFFMYGTGNADSYIQTMKSRNNSFNMNDEDFLKEQYSVYQLLEKEYEKGIEVFQYMPIDVSWNPKGYFNIIDGHHRCIFYWLKGMQSMPVRMKKADYNTWINRSCLNFINDFIAKNQQVFAVKSTNPVLRKYSCQYKEYELTVLDALTKWLYDSQENFHSVLEISNYQANYGKNLYRMQKAEKITSIVHQNEIELANILCRLEHIPEDAITIIGYLNKGNCNDSYDLGLLCGVYGIEELKENLDYLNICIKKVLFWQSHEDIELEKEYILKQSNFKNYTYLTTKCLDGKACEIGTFNK